MEEGAIDALRLATTDALARRRRRVRATRWLGLSSVASWVLAFAIDFGLRRGEGVLAFVVSVLLAVAAIVALGLTLRADRRGRRYRRVRVDGAVLTLETARAAERGAPAVALDAVASAWSSGETAVALWMRDGTLHELDLRTHEDARGFLARLSTRQGPRVLRFPLRAEGGSSTGAQILALAFVLYGLSGVALAGAHDLASGIEVAKVIAMSLCVGGVLGAAIGLRSALHRLELGEVAVGLDGLVITRAGLRRFVPIGEIEGARSSGHAVVITRTAGPTAPSEEISLLVGVTGEADDERSLAIATAIEEAVAMRGRRASSVGRELDRGGRSKAAWRKELDRVTAGSGDYRSRALGPTELAAVVLDAAAPPDRRVGAAVALAARSPDEARERVRIATLAIADEDLKTTLEAAAEGEIDEARLERSLRVHARAAR